MKRAALVCLFLAACAWSPPKPEEPIGGGSLRMGDVMDGVLAKKHELAACGARKEPGPTIKIVMQWNIGADGRTSKARLAPGSEQFANTALVACITRVVESMVFPESDVGAEAVRFPFKF